MPKITQIQVVRKVVENVGDYEFDILGLGDDMKIYRYAVVTSENEVGEKVTNTMWLLY